MSRIILASASPRRKEILSMLGIDFEVIVSSADEKSDIKEPSGLVGYLSKIKAESVYNKNPNSIVIGADTVVYLPEVGIMGKPKSKTDAYNMISALSGKTHEVFTGVTVTDISGSVTFSTVTHVTFKKLSEDEIESYVSTDEPYDKAGAYAVQGRAGVFVERLDGDYFNVVGLPISPLYDVLRKKEVRLWEHTI